MSGHVFTPTGAFRAWATVTLLIVCFGVALGLVVAYVRKVDRDAEVRNLQRAREICGIVRLIDDRNQELPPATDPATADFRAELHRYRTALGC